MDDSCRWMLNGNATRETKGRGLSLSIALFSLGLGYGIFCMKVFFSRREKIGPFAFAFSYFFFFFLIHSYACFKLCLASNERRGWKGRWQTHGHRITTQVQRFERVDCFVCFFFCFVLYIYVKINERESFSCFSPPCHIPIPNSKPPQNRHACTENSVPPTRTDK